MEKRKPGFTVKENVNSNCEKTTTTTTKELSRLLLTNNQRK